MTIQEQPTKVFYKKKLFLKFLQYLQAGKHLCWSLFLIKLQALGLRPATLLKRDSNTGVFL